MSAAEGEAAQQRELTQGDDQGRSAVQNGHYEPDLEVNGANLAKPNQATISQVYRPGFFKIGNPGPLGLISFAITSFTLGFYQCGVGLPESNPLGSVGPDASIFGLAVFFGGASQFIAGVMEFRVGNTFGSTLHCSFGAFWLSYAMFLVPSLGIAQAYGGDERAFTVSVGIYLLAWFLLTSIFLLAALRTNITIIFVLFTLAMAFLLLGCSRLVATTHTTTAVRLSRAGGAFTIITGLSALYAGASGLMQKETTWISFPLGSIESITHRGPNKRAA